MAAVTSMSDSRSERDIWSVLSRVMDPEIPVVSVVDLGIVRAVRVKGDDVEVDVTPTYTGCPATQLIEAEILAALQRNGYPQARVRRVLSPAWTTDWITAAGRDKLRDFGIAPPVQGKPAPGAPSSVQRRVSALLGDEPEVPCPRCGSKNTRKVSNFGSTPCKAHYTCVDCLEPFDYFKCH
jgi:ring-1,2-phenylacetyl-CoA epoxidase subunit PaaD